MQINEEIFQLFKSRYQGLSDEEIEKYATMMSKKYSTIKSGDNVIHLDYYGGLITESEIAYIKNLLKQHSLDLSRFDKNGVIYASIEEFELQLALFINKPVAQSILLGLGVNALWDTIKKIALLVWFKVRQRNLNRYVSQGKNANLNFGLKIKLENNTSIELKLGDDLSEGSVEMALDKIIDLVISLNKTDGSHKLDNFYVFDTQKEEWKWVDIMNEMRIMFENQSKRKKDKS